jgi:uncharacterized protein
MNINVSKISEEDGRRIDLLFPEGEPKLRSKDGEIIGQSHLGAVAARKGAQVKLSGRVEAVVSIDCARCLAPVRVSVVEPFDLTYLPSSRPEADKDDKELTEEDLSVVFYYDGAIDLEDLVREQVELALPMSRICDSQCQGLCPECGTNLNKGECKCASDGVDARWSVLEQWKSNKF